ncbi:GntR family transcriptional regulator [Rhodococcus pseudokoreensis]|uniref:GntR family transcriptional regulator n=1 Tax=Rhodococcus pseudokoreensis TaxID=2811421 RepID=A0A974ZTF1_9NOCA|nr:GntR family transcriptional regulator [Rhodococcus pseudokoreensis]QSE89801.1 GntR family transcriptional regulator [Rhodococcus pseudokoreensis]
MESNLRTRSVADAVEEALRERILTGREEPGGVVTEVGVAERFGVGRPTAKAAVDRLVTDGLLIRDGRRGCMVPVLSAVDLADLYDSRLLVEQFVHARLASRASVPTAATVANATLQHAAIIGDAALVVSADVDFHLALVEADGSPRLQRMHSTLMAEAHFCMARVQANQLLSADIIAAEHSEILRLIAAGDVQGVQDATAAHLNNARDKLLASRDRSANTMIRT